VVPAPVETGEPRLVSAPPAPTECIDTVGPPWSSEASSPPDGLKAIDIGVATENGEPVTWVSGPPEPTENIDTAPAPSLSEVASNPPDGLKATPNGVIRLGGANGEPATGLNPPSEPTVSIETVPCAKLVAASS
jgi:hypothetical protein